MKFKTIHSNSNSFIKRLSLYFKNGSIKLHIILSDDQDAPHSHPWNFTSIILFGGYIEEVLMSDNSIQKKEFRLLNVNKKKYYQKHKLSLKRIFGIKIPCITVGWYSNKIQLCSFCSDLGYCKESAKS
jgi:hypothetical protein